MSNSIIDQQRDNETFFWVQHSWLPGPVKPYDHKADFKRLQEQGAKLVYIKKLGEAVIETIELLYGLK